MGIHQESAQAHCDNPKRVHTLSEVHAEKSNQELEDEIKTLAANINAATYRLLVLIAEFEKRSAWKGWGYKSCAHWLNVRCGIGMAAARDRVRVACALKELPKISAAFAAGKLSFSKAREMTRIAHAENEDYLLTIAEHGSATHVAELVRRYRGVERREACKKAMSQQAERELKYFWDDEGCLNLKGRLPPEQGAVFLQALQTALEQIEFVEDEEPEEKIENQPENATAVASLLEEQRKKKINGPKQRADALMLIADQFISTPDSEQAANDYRTADRFQVVVHVDAESLVDEREKPPQEYCELEDGPTLAAETIKRLCCDSSLLAIRKDSAGNPLNIGRKTRVIPPAMRRALLARDKGCVFPGCTTRSTRYVDGHHIQHWADGGATCLENLACLCRHHHRLVHEVGFDVQRDSGGNFIFFDSDGNDLPTKPPITKANERVECLNAQNKLCIDEKTVFHQLDRDMDYGMAVDALLRRRE